MKILDILEARYYKRPTLKQIELRLEELSHETVRGDIYVADWTRTIFDDNIHADIYVYGIEEHDNVVSAIKRFLDHHGIPFTRIWNVINTTYRHETAVYTATMTYDPLPKDRELTEARYSATKGDTR